MLKCGGCRSEFYLSDIIDFIEHKASSPTCRIQIFETGNENRAPSDECLTCGTCPQKFNNAQRLLEHAQYTHNIKIFVQSEPAPKSTFQAATENTSQTTIHQQPISSQCCTKIHPLSASENSSSSSSMENYLPSNHQLKDSTNNNNQKPTHQQQSQQQQQQQNQQQQTNEIFINFVSGGSDKHQDLMRSSSYNITVSSSKNEPSVAKESSSDKNLTIKEETSHNAASLSSSSHINSGIYANEASTSSGGTAYETNGDLAQKRKRKSLNKQFNCDQCDAKFNQKIHLTKHSAKHTGIKPFKCTECNYSTVERSHLKVHIRIHTGEKPFKCTYCEYATAQSSTLKIHKKRHHNDSNSLEGSSGAYMIGQQPMWTATGNMSSENGNNKIQVNLMRNYEMVDDDDDDVDDDDDEVRFVDSAEHLIEIGDESTCSNRLVVDCDVNNNSSDDVVTKKEENSGEASSQAFGKFDLDKYEGPLDCRKKFFLNTQKRMKMEKMESDASGVSAAADSDSKKAAANKLLGLANVALESETI